MLCHRCVWEDIDQQLVTFSADMDFIRSQGGITEATASAGGCCGGASSCC